MKGRLFAAWMLVLGSVSNGYAGESEADLIQCMRANLPPAVRIQEVEIVAVDRGGGERALRGRLYATREDGLARVMLRIDEPSDLSGAAYLLRETATQDEMYLYLPAINRVRRISGSGGDSKLFGTDLSYNDLKQVQNAFSGARISLVEPGTIDGRAVKILSITPEAALESRYDRLLASVDATTCVALAVEFYEGDELRKRLKVPVEALQQVGKYWFASQAQMTDLRESTTTRLKVTGVRSEEDLSGRYFNPRSFYLGG